ncbi:hypothetical protein V2J09_003591 [Rumex salicifolius]
MKNTTPEQRIHLLKFFSSKTCTPLEFRYFTGQLLHRFVAEWCVPTSSVHDKVPYASNTKAPIFLSLFSAVFSISSPNGELEISLIFFLLFLFLPSQIPLLLPPAPPLSASRNRRSREAVDDSFPAWRNCHYFLFE